ncbi:hypothetical protein [Zwartia panacis]|uniref:hypothetical protein n=1 Tax=Zwartia panacis TaxID=2683345 RepID=UPI0025B5F70C|nr:hypothetical protein [Zwartia panacis]MDN4015897.1 hypothetical protein [Zwartia panacis]
MQVANLVIQMAADVARLKTDMDSARRTVDRVMTDIRKSADMATKALGAIGVGFSVMAFANWIKGAIDAADKINDLSHASGIAGTTLYGLQYAAKLSGTTLEDTASAINKLSVSISGNAAKYQALGISAKDPVEAFKELATIFAKTEDPQQRAALAAEALGKSWQGVAPLLAEGADGIQRLIEEGIALSGVTPEVIDNAAKFNDQLDILAMRSQGAALTLAGPFLSSVVDAMEEMSAATKIAGGFWNALVTFGTMNPFGTLEEGVKSYTEEVAYLEQKIQKYNQSNSDTRALEEALATVKKKLEFSQFRLNQEISAQAKASKEATAATDSHILAYNKMKMSADELIANMEHESLLMGMTNGEREKSIALRKLEEIGIRAGSSALDEYLPKIEAIVAQNEATRARIKTEQDAQAAAKLAQSEAKRLAEERLRSIKAIEDEIVQLKFDTEALTMGNVQKEQTIFLQKLQNAGIKEGSEEWKKYADSYSAALLDQQAVQSIIDSNKKIEEDRKKAAEKATADRLKTEQEFADEIKSINNQIGQSLTDALMQGGLNAKEFLVNMFKTMVLRPVLQPIIKGFVGAFTSSALTAAAASADGTSEVAVSGGSVSNSLGLTSAASTLKTAYEMVTGGFTSLGATVTSFVSEVGATAFMTAEAGGAMQSAGLSMMEAAGTIGSVASYVGGIGAGLGLGNLISGGKAVGGSSWLTVGGGTAIGAMVGGPLGAAIGGVVGGLVNAAFGTGKKEVEDTGISVRFNAMKTTVDAYEEWSKSGGWFSGGDSGTEITQVDAKIQKYFDNAVGLTALKVKQYADILKLPALNIADFSFEVKQSLKGLSAEDAQKKINEIIAAYGNALASFATSEIGAVQREGEQAGATLTRLATSLNTVNSVFDTLNISLMETSVYGADAASKLVELFGGVEQFVKTTDYYYQNFYSTQERVAKTTEQLTKVFAQLGFALPQTKQAFRALVESARAAGNNQLLANLLQLAPSFNELVTASDQLAQQTIQAAQASSKQTIASRVQTAASQDQATAIETVTQAINNSVISLEQLSSMTDQAFAGVQSAISNELESTLKRLSDRFDALNKNLEQQKKAAEAIKQVASESISAIQGVFDLLGGKIKDILQIAGLGQTPAQGAAFITQALEAAKSTGYLPDQNALSDAIDAAMSGLSADNYESAFEMRKANLKVATDLQALQVIGAEQMSFAQQQLVIAENQLATLEAQTAQAQAQYDAEVERTRSYYDSQLQYAQLQINELRGVNASVISVAQAMAVLGVSIAAERAAASAAANSASAESPNNRESSITQMYRDLLGREPDSGGLANWVGSSLSLSEVQQGILGSQEYQARGYATGGFYPGGLAMVGEHGPELINFKNPGMVYTAEQTSGLLTGGSKIAEELRSLREDNRAQARSVVQLQARMTRLLERWDGDGMPEQRVVSA